MLSVRFGLDCGRDVEGLVDDKTLFWSNMNNKEREWISITTTAGLMSVRKAQIATITWKQESEPSRLSDSSVPPQHWEAARG